MIVKERIIAFWFWCKENKEKKILLFLGVFLVLGVMISWFFLQKSKPLTQPSPSVSVQPTKTLEVSLPKVTPQPLPPPQVFFETYENKTSLPQVPEAVNTYSFKTNYSLEEALTLGGKLGLDQYKQEGNFILMYNLEDKEKRGLLTFNQETGGFSFQSYGLTRGPTASTNPQTVAATFLASLGVSDETVSCNITYQRKELPEATFVECHRDWARVGLPILNFVGVLNIPENKPLAEVVLGGVDENMPNDDSIINTSTGEDGKIRPNDFNTATVAVANDGRILSVESSLRQIAQTTVNTSQELLTSQQALDQFINHQAQLSLTIPAGAGVVDWDKVYQNNLAQAKQATITDYVLTYLEKPAQVPQDKLVPYYLIRGLAQLTTGYNVRFVEIVSAFVPFSGTSADKPANWASIFGGQVAGYQSAPGETGESIYLAQESIKLGTIVTPSVAYQLSPTPPLTPSLTDQPPITRLSSPTPASSNLPPQCPAPQGEEIVLNVPGLGELVVVNTQAYSGSFFFKAASFPTTSMDEVRDAFFLVVKEQYKNNVAGWLINNQDKAMPLPTTLDDMYRLFGWTDSGQSFPNKFPPFCLWIGPIPPPPNCYSPFAGAYFIDMQRLNSVSQNVAQEMLTAIKQGEIVALAQRPNYFPQEWINSLVMLFFRYSSRGMSLIGNNPCFISGNSPLLYFYPTDKVELTVKVTGPVVYTDPATITDKGWQVVAYPNSELRIKNYELRRKLYYEYDKSKVSFTELKEGFVVRREEWENFVREQLGPQLGLAAKETADLVVDVRNALVDIENKEYPYLKISFVDRKELDERLPITIDPQPDIFHRVHLLLTPLESYQKVDQPKLNQLPRNGFTVVEVGAGIR